MASSNKMDIKMHANDNQNIQREAIDVLIRRNSFYVLIERSIIPVINFLITIYIVRRLTVDEFGIYNILLAVMGYVGLLSGLGLSNIFVRFIPEFYQKRQIANLKKLVEKGLLWRFVICVGIILIILLFSVQIGELFKFKIPIQYIIIFSTAIIFSLESGLLSGALTSVFHHKNYVIAQICYTILRAGILYYLLKSKGLVGLLITESIAFGFLFIVQFFYYRRFLAIHSLEEKTELPFKRLLRFGGYSYFNEIGSKILSVHTDFFVISAFLGPVAVGIYAFANKIMNLTTHVLPHSMFINIIRPAFFTRYTINKDPEQINKMFNFLVKLIAFFAFPLVTGIFVLGDKLIIYAFDPKYLVSLRVLWIVAAFAVLSFFLEPVGLVLQSIEKVKILFFSKIFAIYNLVADLLVIKPYGIIGIALATGSAVLFKNIFCYLFAKRYTRLRIDFKGLGMIAINSLFMGFILYLFRNMVVDLPSFIVIIIFGGVIYFVVAHFNRAFSEKERDVINKILPRPVFSF